MIKNLDRTENQQLFDYYDAPFKPDDILMCGFNVVEKNLLKNPNHQPEPAQTRIDPRTKQSISRKVYNHSTRYRNYLFKGSVISTLSKHEHSLCLGFFQSLKNRRMVRPEQAQCINETAERRERERQDFLQFLDFYNEVHFYRIYSPERTREGVYKKLYEFEARKARNRYPNGTFQLHTGFPLPQTCCSVDSPGRVTDVRTLVSREATQLLPANVEFSVLGANLDKFMNLYTGQQPSTEPPPVDRREVDFEIPLDTLVFLFGTEDNVDTPTEVVINVRTTDDGESLVEMSEPLPARNSGVHTATRVANKCLQPFIYVLGKECPEIKADNYPGEYCLHLCDDYMANLDRTPPPTPAFDESNLVEWKLGVENSERQFTILTQTAPGSIDPLQRRVFQSIKLEFKPEVGCEVMSKPSLLREWFEHKLCDAAQVVTDRYHLKASNFKCILRESYSTANIEEQLRDNYKCDMKLLIGGLWHIFSLLKNVPKGRYLLCFNPSFRDKLMLYSEVSVQTSKTIAVLHDLLQRSPSNFEFMLQMKLIPISSTVFSDVHTDHRVLPCAFPPGPARRTSKYVSFSSLDELRRQSRMPIPKRKRNAKVKTKKKKKRKKVAPNPQTSALS